MAAPEFAQAQINLQKSYFILLINHVLNLNIMKWEKIHTKQQSKGGVELVLYNSGGTEGGNASERHEVSS